MHSTGRPPKQGLYDPAHEHDACGVGFIANIRGEASHQLVRDGIELLVRLEHRGACGCDPESGDGAGVLIQLPDAVLREKCGALGIDLPEKSAYASGLFFFDPNPTEEEWQRNCFEQTATEEGRSFLYTGRPPLRRLRLQQLHPPE